MFVQSCTKCPLYCLLLLRILLVLIFNKYVIRICAKYQNNSLESLYFLNIFKFTYKWEWFIILTLFAQLTYVNVLHWLEGLYYFVFLVNKGIYLILVIQTFYPSALDVLYNKDVYSPLLLYHPLLFLLLYLNPFWLYKTLSYCGIWYDISMYLEVGMTNVYGLALKTLLLGLRA